ncbi:MAG: hypothetical protein IPK46_21915 [Saprospiraceae bacterium]|nr:hypothetical protein [Saprospiraceae bacterium]
MIVGIFILMFLSVNWIGLILFVVILLSPIYTPGKKDGNFFLGIIAFLFLDAAVMTMLMQLAYWIPVIKIRHLDGITY